MEYQNNPHHWRSYKVVAWNFVSEFNVSQLLINSLTLKHEVTRNTSLTLCIFDVFSTIQWICFSTLIKKRNFIGIFEKCGKFFAQIFDKSTLSLVRLHTQLLSSSNVFIVVIQYHQHPGFRTKPSHLYGTLRHKSLQNKQMEKVQTAILG